MTHHPTRLSSALTRRSLAGRAVIAGAVLGLGSRRGPAFADAADTGTLGP